MARTQAADFEQRRDAIVAKAAQLFARTGFLGASMASIADACATSKSLLYHYYSSKEEILYAVMASHIDQLEQDVHEALSEDADPTRKLHTLVHRFMRHYVGAADRQKVLLNELDNLPSAKRRVIVDKQRFIIDAVVDLLGEIHPDLATDPIQLRAKTMLLFGMINWTHTWYNPKGKLRPDAIADMALGLILGEQRSLELTG